MTKNLNLAQPPSEEVQWVIALKEHPEYHCTATAQTAYQAWLRSDFKSLPFHTVVVTRAVAA